jgi:CheY-like chemotaxis protein
MSKLLLIEDYPVIQDMYGKVLRSEGFDVDIVSDGGEALTKVANEKYDFVLVDLLLPQVNGVEFLEKFRNHGTTEVIVLSDFDYKDTVEKAHALGVKHYWLKVENQPHDLAKKLKELLSKKQKI